MEARNAKKTLDNPEWSARDTLKGVRPSLRSRANHSGLSYGFTVLEVIIVAVFASLLLILFFVQKANIDAMERDEDRKIAINAMYYALEEGFYAEHGYYPESISEENIKVIDPALWTDPSGNNIGQPGSSYSYQPANCQNGKCKEYTLKADLEKENAYVKYNRN